MRRPRPRSTAVRRFRRENQTPRRISAVPVGERRTEAAYMHSHLAESGSSAHAERKTSPKDGDPKEGRNFVLLPFCPLAFLPACAQTRAGLDAAASGG